MARLMAALLTAGFLMTTAVASADWSWTGYEDGLWGEYDQIDLYYVEGDLLNTPDYTPAFTDLSGGWQNWDDVNTFNMAVAYGPATSGVTNYTLNFFAYDYPPSAGYSVLLYQVALGTTVVGRAAYQFEPNGNIYGGLISDALWYECGGGEPLQLPSAVPEPISTTLFILGGATMAIRKLRRK